MISIILSDWWLRVYFSKSQFKSFPGKECHSPEALRHGIVFKKAQVTEDKWQSECRFYICHGFTRFTRYCSREVSCWWTFTFTSISPYFDCFLPEIINHAYILLQTNKLRMTLAQGKEPTVLYQHIAGYYFIWIIQSAAWKSCFLTRISFCRSKVRGAILNDTEDDG